MECRCENSAIWLFQTQVEDVFKEMPACQHFPYLDMCNQKKLLVHILCNIQT